MALTKADIVKEVLEDLVVLGVGETASNSDIAAVTVRFGPMVADLVRREICYDFDESAIPAEYFNHLVKILKNIAGPKFGAKDEREQRLEAELALKELSPNPRPRELKIDRAL